MTFTPIDNWGVFPETRPCIIAGPCSAESRSQVYDTARELGRLGVGVFRAGVWKPRTHPGSFEGVGEKALEWLKGVQSSLGMKVCTEVAGAKHVEQCLKAGLDMVWIGARTTANPFLVQEIADALKGVDIPVLVKNPVSPDLSLWMGAIERLSNAGIIRMAVVHRGFTPSARSRYRNDALWQIPIQLRSLCPDMPFFCDPSHLTGDSRYIGEVSQLALDLGLEGLMIESHVNPAAALSDVQQQLSPKQLEEVLGALKVRECSSDRREFSEHLELLRARIDEADDAILAALSARMNASREIGMYKKENNVAIIQTSRWDKVLQRVLDRGGDYGIDREFLAKLYNLIHEESVRTQK